MIDHLPQDPAMLVSAINMLLRDQEFDSLDDLCSYFDCKQEEIIRVLKESGYTYDESQKQFKG